MANVERPGINVRVRKSWGRIEWDVQLNLGTDTQPVATHFHTLHPPREDLLRRIDSDARRDASHGPPEIPQAKRVLTCGDQVPAVWSPLQGGEATHLPLREWAASTGWIDQEHHAPIEIGTGRAAPEDRRVRMLRIEDGLWAEIRVWIIRIVVGKGERVGRSSRERDGPGQHSAQEEGQHGIIMHRWRASGSPGGLRAFSAPGAALAVLHLDCDSQQKRAVRKVIGDSDALPPDTEAVLAQQVPGIIHLTCAPLLLMSAR